MRGLLPSAYKPGDRSILIPSKTQKEMCARLSRYFSGRITNGISQQMMGDWKKGDYLPQGVPLPPAMSVGDCPTEAVADWYEQHMLKYYEPQPDDKRSEKKSIHEQGLEAVARTKIHNEKRALIELRVMEGTYQPVEAYIRNLRVLGTVLNQSINSFMEKGIAKDVLALPEVEILPEAERASFGIAVSSACEKGADALRASLAAALRQAGESVTQ